MDNPKLTSCSGLQGLKRLDGAVVVENGLTSLRGLQGLQQIGELVVAHNAELGDLDALSASVGVSDIEDNGAGSPGRPLDVTPVAEKPVAPGSSG